MDKLHSSQLDTFFAAVLSLQTVEECYKFFEDACTVKELRDLGQRFAVARMLAAGQVYAGIAKETGASTATIGRVNKSLLYGSDGYKLAIERLKNKA